MEWVNDRSGQHSPLHAVGGSDLDSGIATKKYWGIDAVMPMRSLFTFWELASLYAERVVHTYATHLPDVWRYEAEYDASTAV